MSRSTDIEGYAFCSGLSALGLASKDPDTHNRIRSAAYLIKGAVLRPKHATSRTDRFSLDIRPLGELIDMYHNREATDRRDKVFALLGMSSDDHIPIGLLPNYSIPWGDLLRQLVQFLIGKETLLQTWDDEEVAVLKSRGLVLGTVSQVPKGGTWDDRQKVDVVLENLPGSLAEWSGRWTLQSSAKSIQEGDVVCLLQGAPRPTIIRPYDDYCAIVASSITPTNDEGFEGVAISWPDCLRQITTFPRELLLVWDWEMSRGGSQQAGDYESFVRCRVSEHTKTDSEIPSSSKTARLGDIALLLGDLGRYKEAVQKLREATETNERMYGRKYTLTLATLDSLARASAYERPDYHQDRRIQPEELEVVADLLGRRGNYTNITREGMAQGARSYCQEVMIILLDQRGDEVQITEEVVEAAAGNLMDGYRVTKLLLNRRGDQTPVTEEVVKAAAGNSMDGYKITKLLFDRWGDQIPFIQEVVEAAAGNSKDGLEILELLLVWWGNQISITEEAVKAAVGNPANAYSITKLLLDRWGDHIFITEEVVKVAAGNESAYGYEMTKLLFDRWGDQIPITEGVVKAAAGNGSCGKMLTKLFLECRETRLLLLKRW